MRKIVVFSGAGLSAESGIPTFRDADGLWEGHRIEDVAAPIGWKKNPYIDTLLEQAGVKDGDAREKYFIDPNPAHSALNGFTVFKGTACEKIPELVEVLCQNIMRHLQSWKLSLFKAERKALVAILIAYKVV